MSIFRQNINSGNRATLDSQYQTIRNLERSLRSLGIDAHPSVSSNLVLCADSASKMEDVFRQLDAHNAQVRLIQQQDDARASLRENYQGSAREAPPVQSYQPPPQPVVEEVTLSLPPPKAPTGPRFCPECGNPNKGVRFCGECGYQLG